MFPTPTTTEETSLPEKSNAKRGDLPDPMVVTRELTKRYQEFAALSNCSLQIPRGEIFGLLGPNGAGKTTLIRLLLGHLHPTSGELSVDGLDPRTDGISLRKQLAYLPGDARLPRHLKGKQVLRFFSQMHPWGDLDRSLDVAKRLELNIHTRVASMSTGMRQKLALAVVFGVDVPLMILDEPTANLDPTVRAMVLDLVTEARHRGRTLIFSSHVLSEIEETCDRVAFLRQGQLAHQMEMSDLFQRHRVTAAARSDQFEIPESLRESVRVSKLMRSGRSLLCIDTDGDLAPMLGWLASLGLEQIRMEPLGLRAVYDAVHTGEEPPQ